MVLVLDVLDVLVVLYLQHHGFRYVEALVVGLILAIAGSFAIEIYLARPALAPMVAGFVPTAEIARNRDMLYIAIGILGATVMPHNLYLHSSIVQTRRYEETAAGKRCATACVGDCLAGFRCASLPQGSDILQACVAIDARLCEQECAGSDFESALCCANSLPPVTTLRPRPSILKASL